MKPILFNTDMVRALLEGRKTVTRRVIDRDIVNSFDMESDGTVISYEDRETGDHYEPTAVCRYQPGDILYVRETWAEMPYGYIYRADDECPEGWDSDDKWRPSIHMPKELARLFLRVKSVRIERLNDMTEEDAIAEGFPDAPAGEDSPLERFSQLWDKTIKPGERDVYGWYGNPYVWVIEFENVSYEEAVTDILE